MKFAHVLSLVAPALAAVRPVELNFHRAHANTNMAEQAPVSLAVEFAGLTAMSRVLWLEGLMLSDSNDKLGLVEIIESDLVVESSALLYYSALARQYNPLDDVIEQRQLFVGLQAWEAMTSQFLGLFEENADVIKDTKEIEGVVTQLTQQKDIALSFVDAFDDFLPDLKDVFEKTRPALEKLYSDAISALSGSSSKKLTRQKPCVPSWK